MLNYPHWWRWKIRDSECLKERILFGRLRFRITDVSSGLADLSAITNRTFDLESITNDNSPDTNCPTRAHVVEESTLFTPFPNREAS